MSEDTARHFTTTARFNLLGNEKQTQVVMYTTCGTVSELWPEGEAPYSEDMRPTEVAQIIRERAKHYLYKSSLPELLAKLDAIDANGSAIDRAWLLARAESLEKRAEKLIRESVALRDEASALEWVESQEVSQ